MKYMLVVCNEHVKDGITHFKVPHVKKISDSKITCSFCKEEAKIGVFYSIPSLENILKVTYTRE
ncbi:hypothetical protein N7983_26470 [Priestia megaterium]|uniref:hypothetical protein n=1 Tax=Priestia megaterium TaxID=1404 RepID=UPI0021D6610C|nr:hypothetical protein [Priestia megaterium]MCU7741289.1 hypothetical protein [Priestia megaterium]MCU7746648.1 hypothetical protein [Priestia megaterium]